MSLYGFTETSSGNTATVSPPSNICITVYNRITNTMTGREGSEGGGRKKEETGVPYRVLKDPYPSKLILLLPLHSALAVV